MSDFDKVLADHIATWASHCGAPRSVYIGQLEVLLRAARRDERERMQRSMAAQVRASEGKVG